MKLRVRSNEIIALRVEDLRMRKKDTLELNISPLVRITKFEDFCSGGKVTDISSKLTSMKTYN